MLALFQFQCSVCILLENNTAKSNTWTLGHLNTWHWTLESCLSDRQSVFIGGVFDYSPSRRIVACPTDNPYSDIHCGLVRQFTQSTNCCLSLSDRQSVLTDGLFDHSPSRRIVACPTDNPYSLTACSTIHSVDDLLLVRPTIYIQTACPTIHTVRYKRTNFQEDEIG